VNFGHTEGLNGDKRTISSSLRLGLVINSRGVSIRAGATSSRIKPTGPGIYHGNIEHFVAKWSTVAEKCTDSLAFRRFRGIFRLSRKTPSSLV
jgi:hypothetical protein